MEICNKEILTVMNFLSKLFFKKKEEEKESSNYFFHFTKKFEHLVSILYNNFMPFYCMENMRYLNMPELKLEGMAYPMVCFCDIPLSRHKLHKKKFGDYGLGLNKEWGIKKNHLTPVVYSSQNSITSAALKNLIEIFLLLEKKLSDEDYRKFKNSVSVLMMHYKPYEGYLFNKNNKQFSKELTRFYDEKEWRYIPLKVDGLNLSLEMKDYLIDKKLVEENEKIQKDNHLIFSPNDIYSIYLTKESEIEILLDRIKCKYKPSELSDIKEKIIINNEK